MDLDRLLLLFDPRSVFSDLVTDFVSAADYNRLSQTCIKLRVSLIVPSPSQGRLFQVYTELGFRVSETAAVKDSSEDSDET